MINRLAIDEKLYPPTQLRILKLLADGMLHTREEIASVCLDDELSTKSNVKPHISYIRKKLPAGMLILFTMTSAYGGGYRLVRTLYSANTGRS